MRAREFIADVRDLLAIHKLRVGIVLACAAAALLTMVILAGRAGSESDSGIPPRGRLAVASTVGVSSDATGAAATTSGGRSSSAWVSTHDLVTAHEALPCTGPDEPINFETFSAGPAVAGLPMTSATRRCDKSAPAGLSPANEVNYTYGRCEPPKGESGCQPPLAIQTWPACQRSLADYAYDGKPIPYRELPGLGGAEIVEIELPLEHRIEVYTKSATVVIFATDPRLVQPALDLLRSRQSGMPLAASAAELKGKPADNLAPPSDGAVKGELSCHT